MGVNLNRYIERFRFTEEGKEMFLTNIKNIAKDSSNTPGPIPFSPAFFWPENDLKRMDPAAQGKLLDWLYEEALTASKTATEDYDYSVAPSTVEELEEEVLMIQYAGAIFRVLQHRDHYHLAVVENDEQGRPLRRFPDGRIEYIEMAKMSGK